MNKQAQQLLKASKLEFNKKCRRISIKNIPSGVLTQDILELLKPFFYQQIHIDKTSQSCKAVLVDGNSAARCINELNGKRFRGQCLSVSLASCDFMLCITQLPLSFTHGQFLSLITPFGTPERCFLVQSEVTGDSKGYGCVEFTSKESSIKAKNKLNGHKIENNTLQVHWLDTIPSSYAGLSSKCLIVEDLPLGFNDDSKLFTIFSLHSKPKFCQLANCYTGEFAIVEYQDSVICEESWRSLNGYNLDGECLKVSFCVPGPCGVVVLNALRASRDLKSANPSGGLLPTPVHLLDHNSQNNGFPMMHQSKLGKDIPGSGINDNMNGSDAKVQRLISSLHSHLVENQIVNQIDKINQSADPTWRPAQPPSQHHGLPLWSDAQRQPNNHVLSLRGRSGSISSSDSVKVDDEVFEPMRRRSQEEPPRQPRQEQEEPAKPFQPSFNTRAPPSDRGLLTSHHFPMAGNPLLLLREDSQRSDSSDSAYGGSQGSNPDLPFAHLKESSQIVHASMLGDGLFNLPQTMDTDSRMLSDVISGRFSPYNLPHHKMQEGTSACFERTLPFPRTVSSAFQIYNQSSSATSRHVPGKQRPLPSRNIDICSRGLRTPTPGFMGADSPTQLRLLGSNLLEGVLGSSPCREMEVETGGRSINALNLFSPIGSTSPMSRTPTPGLRRGVGHVLPSPEPSPEAGAYVGQHSQGLGGHYAETHLGGSPFMLHLRRRSNET